MAAQPCWSIKRCKRSTLAMMFRCCPVMEIPPAPWGSVPNAGLRIERRLSPAYYSAMTAHEPPPLQTPGVGATWMVTAPSGRPITQHRPQAPWGSGAAWLFCEFGRLDSQAVIMVSAILAASLQGQHVQAFDREGLRGLWLRSSVAASGRGDGQSRSWFILARLPPHHTRRVSRRLQAQVASEARDKRLG